MVYLFFRITKKIIIIIFFLSRHSIIFGIVSITNKNKILLTSKHFNSSFKLYSDRSLKTIALFIFDSKSLIQILKVLSLSNNLFVF